MILLLGPGIFHDEQKVIDEVMKRYGFTKAEDIEPAAGCRRLRLS
jgi:hypothetical protein